MAKEKKTAPAEAPAAGKKRGKCCLGILAVIVLFVAVGLWLAGRQAGNLVKEAVERYGPDATGTSVSLAEVKCSLLQGRGQISGLTVESPEGFDSPNAILVEQASLDVAVSALFDRLLHVQSMTAEGVSVFAESGPAGNNLGSIASRLRLFAGKKGPAAGTPPVIDTCHLKNMRLSLSTTGMPAQQRRVVCHIGEVNGSLSEGRFTISGIAVSNPHGYRSDTAMSLPEITIRLDPKSLWTEELIVEEVVVKGGSAIYETSVAGSNFSTLERELARFEAAMGKKEKTQSFRIVNLYIRGMKGQLSPSLLRNVGIRPVVEIPAIHLKNLRSESGAGMLALITASVTRPFDEAGKGLVSGLGKVGKAVQETGKSVLQGTAEGAKTFLKRFGLPVGEKEKDDSILIGDE